MKVLTIRLDDELHARVKQAADREARSLNGQIAWLLQAGLQIAKMLEGTQERLNDDLRPDSRAALMARLDAGKSASDEEKPAARSRTVVGYSKERQARGKR